MNERINLKEIERKAYTSYHQDGIIDILIGLSVLNFAVWIIADMIWLGWMSFIVATSIYAAAKKAITVPRIGFVKFPQQRSKTIIWGAVGLAVLLNVLGLITFMQVEGGSTPTWLVFAIEHYMIVIGVVVAALFCFVGYTFRTNRIYAYALLTLVIFVVGYLITSPLHYYLILLGTLILFAGLAILIRFIRRYPLQAPGSTGESTNEAP